MRRFCGLLVLFTATLSAQTLRPAPGSLNIDSTLTLLERQTLPRVVASQVLASIMMDLQSGAHQAKRADVISFTLALTYALAGRSLDGQKTVIRQSLVSLCRDPGVSNFSLAQQLQNALAALHVRDSESSDVIRRFIAIGEAVRGPDDSPALPE